MFLLQNVKSVLKMNLKVDVNFASEPYLQAMNRVLERMEVIQTEQSEILDQVRQQMASETALRLPPPPPPPPHLPLRPPRRPRSSLSFEW